MKRIVAVVVTVAVIGLMAPITHAVDAATQAHIDQLQAQIDQLEQQAQQFRDGIATQQDKAASLNRDIAILQGQIGQLQAQISANGARIDVTQTQISDAQNHISLTQQTIEQKRATIGRLILFLDQGDQLEVVATILKYPNLSTVLTQIHDVGQLQGEMIGTVDDLQQAKTDLETTKTGLETQQSKLQQLQNEVLSQKGQLDSVKSEKSKVLKDTKGQEALYQKQLTDVEKKQAAFFKEQQQLESQVVAGGLYIVHITATNVPPRGTKLFTLPEDHPRLTQGYGYTSYARRGAYGGLPHSGVDYATGYGTPILAIGPGILIAHGTNDGFGNWIAVQHPNNMVSIYGHMSRFAPLAVGTQLTQGQVIGYEGDTGNVTGSHVHLSLYKDFFTYVSGKNGQLYFNYFDGTVNPLDYLKT